MNTTPVAVSTGHFLPSSRYRHPGDVIRLICGGILLAGAVTASAVASRWLLGPAAAVPDALGSGSASRVLTGMVQAACVAAAALVVAATLGRRRFRLLAGLAAGAAVAAVLEAIEALLVAGLTGIGISPGPAWSAVLTYRLATYWLPVAPGWFSWRLLQRMGYV